MVKQNTSIQSFFPLQTSPIKGLPRTYSPTPGDGFTAKELDTSLVLAPRDDWIPPAVYHEYEIDSLVSGPNRIKIFGRIVNMFETSPKAKLPTGAKGAIHLVVKDNTGAVTVSICSPSLPAHILSQLKIRLSYTLISYGLQLGQLVAVWAAYITNGDRGIFPCAVAPLYIRIFPEKDKSCHIRWLDGSGTAQVCRKPLKYDSTLMSLKDFIQGGYEVPDAKILVIVKSISTRKRGNRLAQCPSSAILTRHSHAKRRYHSRTRESRRDGRYKRSDTVVVGCHLDESDELAAIADRATYHESKSECFTSELASIDIEHIRRRGSDNFGGRKTSSIRWTDDQEATHQSDFS